MQVLTLIIESAPSSQGGAQQAYQSEYHIERIGVHRIGRALQMDWILPDEARHISNHHCEIIYDGSTYMLHDVSTNGVYLNGSPSRLIRPHQITHADQIQLGAYHIRARISSAHYKEKHEDVSITLDKFLKIFAQTANIPMHIVLEQPHAHLAEKLGTVLLNTVLHMKQLMTAQSKTMEMFPHAAPEFYALENNALYSAPTLQQAIVGLIDNNKLEHKDLTKTLDEGFELVKRHQINTLSAMQKAIQKLITELDPATLDKNQEKESTIAALITSRKAKLWEQYTAQWLAQASQHDEGMSGVFMKYFTENYGKHTS